MDFFETKKFFVKSLVIFFVVENLVFGPRITLVVFNTYRERQIMELLFLYEKDTWVVDR